MTTWLTYPSTPGRPRWSRRKRNKIEWRLARIRRGWRRRERDTRAIARLLAAGYGGIDSASRALGVVTPSTVEFAALILTGEMRTQRFK